MDEKNRTDVEKMIQGDESAFDELYRSFSGKLYRMAYFITGNQSDSEDVLQETFVKCYLHRKSLKDPERFEAWLYQILVRTAWKLCRKGVRFPWMRFWKTRMTGEWPSNSTGMTRKDLWNSF